MTTASPEGSAPPSVAAPPERPLLSWRAAAARALGVDAVTRERVVAAMLERHAREAVQYWLQLLLAMGIATMGLVLNSTAVVIGAMLISPLMGPIVELGMGLVVGSAFLVLRAGARVLGSVLVVVGSAAAITLTLPFHEVTPEIAARTAPTLLDLLVAVFCALAAAFTAVRDTSESTSAAAGTAIGIALVPPLCVIGYGLGTWHTHVALGASLLFTANLSAIVLFAVLVFLGLGFESTPIRALEDRVLTGERATHRTERVASALRRVFGARYGAVLRLSMPLVLVGAVFVPLRQALTEVAWQVRVRAAILGLLNDSSLTRNAVRSLVAVERHAVDVRLVVVAQPDDAETLERDLRARILRVAAVEPTVSVVAVPDYRTLRQTVVALERPSLPPEPPRPPDLEEVRSRVARGLADVWPRAATGRVLAWTLAFPPRSPPRIEVVHVGPALGPGSDALLARAFESERGLVVTVATEAVPEAPVDASALEGARWLPSLVRAVDLAARHDALSVCVATPPDDPSDPGAARMVEAVREELAHLPGERAALVSADRWSVRVGLAPCPPPPSPAAPDADAGAPAPPDAARRRGVRATADPPLAPPPHTRR